MRRSALFMTGTLIILIIAASAPPAMASSVQCANSNAGWQNCLKTTGSGVHVDSFRVIRSVLWGAATICDYSAKVTVTKNGAYATGGYMSGGFHDGCVWSTAWVNFYPNRNYPDGSIACGYFYIDNGTLSKGYPCAHIHK